MAQTSPKGNTGASGSTIPSERKVNTVRIRDIPSGKTSDALKRDIEAVIQGQDVDPKIHIEHHSFVPQDESSICATVSFHTVLPRLELLALLSEADSCKAYDIDDHFLDITPLGQDPEGVDIDVIAVSDLASHPLGSFKSPSRDKVWLRDFLPKDIPRIRVLLYGYSSPLQNSRSKDSIEDLGNRLLEDLKAFRGDEVEVRLSLCT